MTQPKVELKHLDNLWFQVTGTLCNIACAHCFNSSGPNVRTFGFLSLERVRSELETAVRLGVKEVFFTGGEPFLHPQLLEMLSLSLARAPTTVLTNGTLITDRVADRLAEIERGGRYSLEVRVSIDGYTEETNDAIRGPGAFRQGQEALGEQPFVPDVVGGQRGQLLPGHALGQPRRRPHRDRFAARHEALLVHAPRQVVTVVQQRRLTFRDVGLGGLVLGHHGGEALLTDEMLVGFDQDLLMCSNSRMVTDRGVWVCPLLIEMPDARLGESLDRVATRYELRHHACMTCYRFGTICGNVSALIEGPANATPSPDRTGR